MKTHIKLITLMMTATLIWTSTFALQYTPTNVAITTESNDQASPCITIDPNNTNHLQATWDDLLHSTGFPLPGYSFSTDGGASWSSPGEITVPSGLDWGFNTSCAIDKSGNESCTYTTRRTFLDYPQTVYISVSTNNGSSWSTHKVSADTSYQDKPYMAVDNTTGSYSGRLYAAWTDFRSGSNILISHSTNEGQNWSSPATIRSIASSPGKGAYSDPILANKPPDTASYAFVNCAIPAIAPNGNVYVVYLSVGGTGKDLDPGAIEFAKSTDGGATFSTASSIASIDSVYWTHRMWNGMNVSNLVLYSDPTIAIDQSSGNIYVAYTTGDAGNANIYYVRSTNGGTTWSSPSVATQTSTGEQFSPWLSVGPSGIVSLVYYQGTSTSMDVYLAQSYNGGSSFSGTDTKLNSSSFDPTVGTLGSEYTGILSCPNGSVLPAWTDMRTTSDENIYTALFVTSPQSFAIGSSGNPYLSWTNVQASGSTSYEVSRKVNSGSWSVIADPTTSSYTDYDWVINSHGSTVSYRVRTVALSSVYSDYSTVKSCKAEADGYRRPVIALQPTKNGLDQNYPNPFNPSTRISYAVKDPSYVRLVVYDQLGKEVKTLVNQMKDPGYYDVTFDSKEQATGLYFYKIQIGKYTEVKKMLLMK